MPRMTAEHAIRRLTEMDKRFISARPTCFGEMAWLVSRLAMRCAESDSCDECQDVSGLITDDDLGDLAFLLEDKSLPKDAGKTWQLP